MIKCKKVLFKANKENINRLFECNRLSAEVWNNALTISKCYSLNNDGKWIGKTKLQEELKKIVPLHSQSIQAVAHKYINARDAAYKAKQKGYDNRYPWRQKKNFNTKWVDKAYTIYDNGKVELSLGAKRKPIVIYIDKKISEIKDSIKEIELIFDRRLMLSISYEDGVEESENINSNICAIDPGEIHTISAYAQNGEAIIITGRKMRSINRFRNKKIAEIQKKMSKCTKYSKQWKKYNKAKRYILSKSEAQLKDCMHKTTKQFVDWCVENQIKEIAIGNVELKLNRKKGKNVGRKNNQKLSNWSIGKLRDYLEYKAKVKGIIIEKIDESYTSQQCPCCGRRKKSIDRNYICKCGYVAHRDIHGARNILSKYINDGTISYIGDIKNIQYKKIA